jgi:acyl-CoA synthetase (NDP forming)
MTWMEALFRPQSVAVVGSVSPGKIGRVLVDQLLQGGFDNVVAVNPKGEGTSDVLGVRSLGEMPEGSSSVDLAVIASPASTVAEVLEDAGNAGVRVAVIITAGFAEAGNVAEEQALRQVADRFAMRIVGPNCAGIVNTKYDLFATLETRPPVGDVAFVSQSGALGGAVLSWAEEQGIGFSKFVSYGNGADLTDVDFLDALREDGETRVVALYVETVSDGRRFMQSARRLTAAKPLIVIKSGRSDSGGRATLSHTGSMAGTDAVFDAALRQCSAIRVDGIEEMFDLCRGFTLLPSAGGSRLAIVTNSGGPGVLAADHAERCGLRVEPPSDRLRDRLEQRLEPFCSFDNPFDLTVEGTGDDYRDTLIDVLTEYDSALAINVNTPYLDSAPLARGIVDAARETGKPIAASFMAGRPAQAALPVLRVGGVPNFATGERAVSAIAALRQQSQRVEGQSPSTVWMGDTPVPRQSLPWDRNPLEPEAMDWLEGLGFPVIERRWARTADEAVDAAREFARPVAMKVISPAIVHKTDANGVILNVSNAEDAVAAFDRLRVIAAGDGLQGVLVAPMISDAIEVLVGLSRDPQFGPVVACGLGGIYTEALDDLALRVAPIDPGEALAMIDELRGAVILRGTRGKARAVDALAALLARVSELPFRFPEIDELDLNPVFLLEAGCAIADVRLARGGRSIDEDEDIPA